MRRTAAVWTAALLLVGSLGAEDAPANRFVFAQLRHAGQWDPYADAWEALAPLLRQTTSLDPWPERRTVGLEDAALADFPFLYLCGRGDPRWSEDDVARLRDHLSGGGFLLIDNTEAARDGPFDRRVRELPARLFGASGWRAVPKGHAFYRAFFLLSRSSGRRLTGEAVEGLWTGDRLVAVYVMNDLLGALARDRLGQPLFPCEPGGELQRTESRKLFVNAVLFSVTGTYKTDAVHQPFLEKKLGRLEP